MKKVISTLLAFIMLLGTVAVGVPEDGISFGLGAFAASEVARGKCGDDLTWVLDDEGTLTISGTGDMWSGIDAEYGWPGDVSRIVISEGVTSVGEYAFYYCAVENVELSDTVEVIGDSSFAGCPLKSINIPRGVSEFAPSALSETYIEELTVDSYNRHYCAVDNVLFSKDMSTLLFCPSGREGAYTVPEGVEVIGEGAFRSCAITSLWLPESLTTIEDYVFEGSGITSVHIPANVTSIGTDAFSYSMVSQITVDSGNGKFECNNNTLFDVPGKTLVRQLSTDEGSYTVPEGIEHIGDSAFSGSSRTSVKLPDSLISIGSDAFTMSAVTSITIPEGVVLIGSGAFSECSSLISVHLPASLSSLDADVFYYSFNMEFITAAEDSRFLSSDGRALYDMVNKKLIYCVPAFEGEYYITDGTRSIGVGAFDGCRLESVFIPDSVQEIGANAFSGCNFLSGVLDIPEGIRTLREGTFQYCGEFEEIHLPSTLEVIEDGAFTYSGAKTIYYNGGADEWNRIDIGIGNYVRGEGDALYGETGWGALSRAVLELSKNSSVSFHNLDCGISVVTDGSEVNLNIDTDFFVNKVEEDDESYFAMSDYGDGIYIFDAYFESNGVRVQPSKPVTVSVPVPDGFNKSYCFVYHINDDRTIELMMASVEGDMLVFEATSFSHYAVVESGSRLPGDVNGDGEVTMIDLTILRRYLADWPGVIIDESNSDVNADGEVNLIDATVLRRYLAGWCDTGLSS